MKIDPTIQFPSDSQPDRVKGTRTSGTSSKAASGSRGVSSPAGEDTVSLSGKHGEVQVLNAQLAHVPEVRTARVNALQQKVQSGNYQPDSHKVADAIVAEHRKVNTRA
ncbi:MAG TPA: flagellar biosynthesis anti-sigma factor FlgM [Terriglobia bacterium]|nr:flagellar biosynthesis anti-sigma factor FlgM [Terriglobia bacterium]